jgi:hypothetical protein
LLSRAREALDDIDGLAAESDVLLLVELEAVLRELFQNGRGRGGTDLPGAPPDDRMGRFSRKLSQKDGGPRASVCGVRLGDRIVVDARVFIVRGVDAMSVDAPRVYLEDAATGELLAELMARVRALAGGEHDESNDEQTIGGSRLPGARRKSCSPEEALLANT